MHRYYYSRPLFEKSERIKFKSIILNSIIERHHSGIAFQLHMSNSSDIIELDLPKHCTTKRLQPNIFGKLRTVLNHQRKFFKQIQATKRTCSLSEINVKCWTIGKAMEFLYLFHLWNNTQRWNDKIFCFIFKRKTLSSDETNRNSPLENLQNTSTELKVNENC